MREIKFRAWDKLGRFGMADVLIIDYSGKYVVVDAGWNHCDEDNTDECCADFNDIELMQFSGLLDKNGKEIYEGDIVTYKSAQEFYEGEKVDDEFSTQHKDVVKFIDGSFTPIPKVYNCEDYYYSWMNYDFEVIGNVYENPELLEG